MEELFPRNVFLKLIFLNPSINKNINVSFHENISGLIENKSKIWEKAKYEVNPFANERVKTNCLKYRIENFTILYKVFSEGFFALINLHFNNISMLKRSYSMEFDSGQFKTSVKAVPLLFDSSQVTGSANGKPDDNESTQIKKKICNSSSFEESKSLAESEVEIALENNRGSSHGRSESYRRYSQSGENSHVTQSRSIFSHRDSFVYGNPKEEIKNIENSPGGDLIGETPSFENNSSSALDLSFKGGKIEEKSYDGNTYHTYQRGNFPKSNVEIKLVNLTNKKPSLPEQLQIAKMQQQQRRSMQQQQKFLQQMRRTLDPKSTNRLETTQSSHKNFKYCGNSTTNHEQNELDNQARVKDEFHQRLAGTHFPHLPYPYFDAGQPKELPDNHPILPLLDPVYFSALYNAHGFLPPSSPSIAAAFIGTLQDALPKLPMMFPSTSSNSSSLHPQKSHENQN